MEKILVAGATGYLGQFITKELKKKGYFTKVLVRNLKKIAVQEIPVDEIVQAEITDRQSMAGCCNGINVVISSVGITKQKDGLTYMDVDYQANLNLLDEAIRCGVRKFIYVSVLNGQKLKNLKICEAKEKFVDALKKSGLDYCIIRPNGFFSDMSEFYKMAMNGRVYLFGNGKLKANPIHGEDLAEVCVNAIRTDQKEIEIGGPETLTQNEIAAIAFSVAGKKSKIIHIPDLIRRLILFVAKLVMPSHNYGPVEFFLSVMAIEMVAPEYGSHTLKKYYEEIKGS